MFFFFNLCVEEKASWGSQQLPGGGRWGREEKTMLFRVTKAGRLSKSRVGAATVGGGPQRERVRLSHVWASRFRMLAGICKGDMEEREAF